MALAISCQAFSGVPTTEDGCRLTLNQPDWISKELRVEQDLLEGVWIEDLDDFDVATKMERIFQFRDFGVLDEIAIFDDGNTSYHHHLWDVVSIDGRVYLDIIDNNLDDQLRYEVEQNCEGLVLTDVVTQDIIFLNYSGKQPDFFVVALFHNFVGDWMHTVYPFELKGAHAEACGTSMEMEGAYLRYQFREDGSYTKEMGNAEIKSIEQGFWEVSKDGQYLVFYVSKDGRPETVYTSQYARILDARLGKFRIEHSMTTSDVDGLFCTAPKAFSFERFHPNDGKTRL